MSDLSKILIKHPSLLHSEEIAEICKPLQKLNISYFAHVQISKDKQFCGIANNPLFTEHYLKNQFFLADIHLLDQTQFGDFFVWDGLEVKNKTAILCQDTDQFGIYNPFTLIEKSENGIDYYHFASPVKSKQINQLYLANLDLLKLFILYFKEKINESKTLAKAYDLKINIDLSSPVHFQTDTLYDRAGFLQNISHNPDKLKIENVQLSKRQSELLRLLVQGKAVKDISRILNLSERTIRHYLETVKSKLNVFSRSELISKALQYLPLR